MTKPRALVLGAGPAGLIAATGLARAGLSVVLAERRDEDSLRHAGEHLPPKGLSQLSALGHGALLSGPGHAESFGVISAWGGAVAERDYVFTLPGRGLNLDRTEFDAALVTRARAAGVALRFGTTLTRLAKTATTFDAELSDSTGAHGQNADMVIDATGRAARAARLLGAAPERFDSLVGIVGTLPATRATDPDTRLRIAALPDGWWYGATLADGRTICAFMTDAEEIRTHPGGAPGLWQAALRSCPMMTDLAAGRAPQGPLQAYDAASQVLTGPLPQGVLALGDAAAAYDPLSSWGIAKAVEDGHRGAEALLRWKAGDAEDAIPRHRHEQRRAWDAYLERRNDIYRAEPRWPTSDFWRRRQRGLCPQEG